MVFSSLLFVFFFLALNITFQGIFSDVRKKNIVMLVFSLIFYAWSGPSLILLLAGMTFIAWGGAMLISSANRPVLRRLLLAVTSALMLGLLAYFKYAGFIASNLKYLLGFPDEIPNIILPVGISFYTFQLLSYVIDVYRNDVEPQKKFWLLLLYASLFHQCIAGPIVRYKDINNDINFRKTNISDISRGITRFTVGLAKKALLANSCASIADSLLSNTDGALASASAIGIFLGGAAFMLQIYLDFSAYSDMAIGMGLMVGFHYLENFNYPYTADSVSDFWRRWHISLSSFFRDYVYIPLGGNRCSAARQIFNLSVVWLLTGLWHGASWNYVLWGVYYLIFLVLEKFVFNFSKTPSRRSRAWRRVYTIGVVYIGWFLFKFENLSELGTALKGLICLNGNAFIDKTASLAFTNNIFFLIIAIIAVTPAMPLLYRRLYDRGRTNILARGVYNVIPILIPPVMLALSVLCLVGNSYNPFLYFQF
jgi:alginate O-acetyltransferase complex protein AlgI